MKHMQNDENLLKSLALQYVNETGARYHCERIALEQEELPLDRLDEKIYAALSHERAIVKRRKRLMVWMTTAASLLIIIFTASYLFNNVSNEIPEATQIPSPPMMAAEQSPLEIDFVSLSAPEGWQIIYTDHDGDVTIFHLESRFGGTVVVSAGLPIYDLTGSAFWPVFIQDVPAYLLVESTHSILIYEQDGFQFVLTTPYDYRDLIMLAGYWL
ncbi:MAG: hypothetical protein FWC91_07925 [Defluviitaleaceae bacterium]|nr:hypothetical protein [Defluviitaleaceae bacterium]